MGTTELRINNYYQAKSPEKKDYEPIYRLDNIGMKQALNNEINLKGIEITEELLFLFGFIKRGIRFSKNGLLLWQDNGKYIFALFESDSKIEKRTVLTYVHQLQNLYNSLTYEELILECSQTSQPIN